MWILALFALASPLTIHAAPAPRAAVLPAESWTTVSEEYVAALRSYTDRKSRAPKGDEKALGPHPARSFYARVRAVAGQGEPSALIWLIENLAAGAPDAATARVDGLWAIGELFAQKSPDSVLLNVMGRVQRQVEPLGEETALALIQAFDEKSSAQEVKAQALWLTGWVRAERGQTRDPARKNEASEIFRTILVEYPHTAACQAAAQALLAETNEQFLAAESEWLAAVEAAQAAGKPAKEWPAQPIEQFHPHFKALSEAGNDVARRWIDNVYSEYLRLPRTPDWSLGMHGIAQSFSNVYPKTAKGAMDVHVRFLAVLYREFPSASWVVPSLRNLNAMADFVPVARTEAALEDLAARSESDEVRALALCVHGEIASTPGDVANDERALALFRRSYTEYPSTAAADPARKAHERLTAVMPGSPAQVTVEIDLAGREMKLADFRGQVVVLDFFLIRDEDCMALAPRRGELAKQFAGRPFALVGGAVGTSAPKRIQDHIAKFGVAFRSFLLPSSTHAVVKNWMIRGYPTTFLIDADGIIRARNPPWEEMSALVEHYVAEAEKKRK